jgi:hypothetical protein
MKLSATYFLIVFVSLFCLNIQAQENKITQSKPDIVITGEETPDLSNVEVIEINGTTNFEPVRAGNLTFEVHSISERFTGYDLQSNASTQQVWVDLGNPDYIHTFFTYSAQSAGWSDRTCLYFGSIDGGAIWFELGSVPNTGRSGFPAVYGKTDGSAVLLNHNNFFGGFTRTTVGVDNSPFEYNFTNYDPGSINDGPVWPRHVVTANDIVVFASAGSPPPDDDVKLNTLDLSTGLFSGWTDLDSDDAESYDFSISPNGKIGLAYLGWDGATPNEAGDVLYRESTDDGLTWSSPQKIYDSDNQFIGDTALGGFRGVAVNFYNEDPCVTYEICQQTFSSALTFFPGLPNEIHFWSPNVNSGNPIVIADSNNVPFNPYFGTNDGHLPFCRPVIGRSENGYLFVAFNATTEHLFPSPDTTSYMAGYFTYSSDGGNTWMDPEKFTPDSPLRDWRYPSIAEVIPVIEDNLVPHIVMQGDSIPGSTVNSEGMPVGVTAQYYHFSTEILVVGVNGSDSIVDEFKLEQNYPNPFNPTTKINYQISETELVSLKVYDILGNEVAILVNEEKPSGIYEIDFNADGLTSGVYFYQLKAGNILQTKKMILLR